MPTARSGLPPTPGKALAALGQGTPFRWNPEEALESVRLIAEEQDLSIVAVTPADFAWAAAFGDGNESKHRGICAVQLRGTKPHLRLLAIGKDEPLAIRRLPLLADDATTVKTLKGLVPELWSDSLTPPSFLALGEADFRDKVDKVAALAGLRPMDAPDAVVEQEHSPEKVAAAYAGIGPRCVPHDVAEAANRRNRRWTGIAAAAAAVLLVLAGWLETFGLQRELVALDHARATHAGVVTAFVEERVTVDDLAAAVSGIDAMRATTPRWTVVLSSLSDGLPAGTRVSSLRAQGDSLDVELETSDAASALDALRGIPWISSFSTAAPVQRSVGEVGEISERVTATALVNWSELNGIAPSGSR